jgi:hypothetical protein
MIDAIVRFIAWLFGSAPTTPPETVAAVRAPVATGPEYRLHVPSSLLRQLRAITQPNATRIEPLAFLFVRFASEETRTTIVGIGISAFPDEAYVEGYAGANFDTDFTVDVANQQIVRNTGLLLVHSHGGKGIPTFSGIDNRTNRDVMGSLASGVTVAPYGALVLSDDNGRCVIAVGGKMIDTKVVSVPDRFDELSVTA